MVSHHSNVNPKTHSRWVITMYLPDYSHSNKPSEIIILQTISMSQYISWSSYGMLDHTVDGVEQYIGQISFTITNWDNYLTKRKGVTLPQSFEVVPWLGGFITFSHVQRQQAHHGERTQLSKTAYFTRQRAKDKGDATAPQSASGAHYQGVRPKDFLLDPMLDDLTILPRGTDINI